MGFLLRTALLVLTTAANLNNSSNLTSHIISTNMDNLNHPEVGQCVDNGCSQEFDGFGVCIDFSLKDVDFATLAQKYRMSANSPPGKCGHHSNDNCCHCLRSEEPPKALALIVIGGDTETGATTSVEVEGNHAKPIPELLEARWGLSAFVVPGSHDLLVCGGKGRHHDPRTAMTCDTFTSPVWQAKTHNLQQPRVYATSVTVESGDIFLMGGWYSSTTSEVLAKGATTWAEGPTLKHEISGACAVSLDAGSQGFAVIGGGSDHKQVSVYKDKKWKEDWGPLEEGRKGHGCVRILNLIFVAGGYSFTYHTYSDTTIILNTQKMLTEQIKMSVARAYFSIQVVHGGILALGGLTGDPSEPFTRTVEKWTPETAVWSPCPDIQLDVGRSAFASVLLLDTTTATTLTTSTTTTIHTTTTSATTTTATTTTTTSTTTKLTGLPIVFSQLPGELELKRDYLITTLPFLGLEWQVSFEFKPTKWDGYAEYNNLAKNILHMKTAASGGDRIPYIGYHHVADRYLTVWLENNFNYEIKPLPPVGQWSTIVLAQVKTGSTTTFSVKINGESSLTMENPSPRKFVSVQVFVASYTGPAQAGFIRGLEIKTQ